MGTSTDAILVFGMPIGYEEETPEFLEEFDGDFDEFLNSKSGLPSWGEPGHDFNNQREFRESFPVDVTMHCSYDYTMYILAVRGTETRASRGYPKTINELPVISEDKISALKAFCEEIGLEYSEPKWLLCSMWG